MPQFDVAILTCQELLSANPADWYIAQVHKEDGLLQQSLEHLGLRVIRLDWADTSFDWSSTRCAVFRTVWDYFHRFDEFAPWLKSTSALTQFINPAETLFWNIDKHYLLDLMANDIQVVPTHMFEKGEQVKLLDFMTQQQWPEIVFKPAISGAARLTYRVSLANASEHEIILNSCLQNESMMIQPFMPAILKDGELSLMVMGGEFTHAIRKTAKQGDFRVQDDHGGTVHPYQPTTDEIAFAENAVRRCGRDCLYARVDMVRGEDNQLYIMELELIEPELFFRFDESAASTLARAIQRRLAHTPK